MKIRSKLTGKEHEIPAEQWEAMKKNGDSRKYNVVSTGSAKAAPKEDKQVSYEADLKKANDLFGKKKFKEAKALYEKLAKINETELIKQRLKVINEELS